MSKTFQGVLRRTYAEESFFGLQVLDVELRRQFAQLVDKGMLVHSQLQNITEMADQHHAMLKKTWRSIAQCSGARDGCKQRKCKCSYADYICYRGLRDAQDRLERQFTHIAKECYELRATWQYVLHPVAMRLLNDRSYKSLFLWTHVLAGDLTESELSVAEMDGHLRVEGFAVLVRLTIGQTQQRICDIPVVHEPHDQRRR